MQPPAAVPGNDVLPPGFQLAEFRIVRLIGQGGFGIVYLAHDTQLDRMVAVKEYMPSALAARTEGGAISVKSDRHRDTFDAGLRSFVNEARLLAQFDHPALVKVYRFWEERGTAYMVMPYYEGPTLKESRRADGGPPPEAWVRGLVASLFDALERLHAVNCFHRDIAPDNILLLQDETGQRPLLLDFGAARRVVGDMTQALTVILKPGYAPVEQYAEVASMRQGPWTDIYALSAVMYYLVTGRPPPPSVGRIMADEFVPAQQVGAGIYSQELLAAIDAGLRVKPEHRPQSVAEFRRLVFGGGGPAPRTAMPRTTMPGSTKPEADDDRTIIATSPLGRPMYANTAILPRATATAPSGAAADAAGASTGSRRNLWIVASVVSVLVAGGLLAWMMRGPSTDPERASIQQAAGRGDKATDAGKASPAGTGTAGTAGASTGAAGTGPAASPAAGTTTAPTPSGATAGTRPPAATASAAASPAALLRQLYETRDPALGVEAAPGTRRLAIGRDMLRFTVRSSVDGYVYVLVAGTDDQHLFQLFPNGRDGYHRIAAGREIRLPRPQWTVTAAGPVGTNRVLVIVSPTLRDFTATGLRQGGEFSEFSLDAARAAVAAGGPAALAGVAQCPPRERNCAGTFGAAYFEIDEYDLAKNPGS